jgi:diaminohydroxyphosphoribosylaminopyrimidine deaminase/5-amino-6-(5-phosphoribosylamino)uracil reductase
MWRCIQLARNGEQGAAPNPMVGAVIVCDGRIIGEGYHIRCGGPHAEVNAIRSVREPELLSRSTIYVSLEPCAHYGKTPPCADLIVEKRIPRVVVGCQDPFAKVNGLGIRKLRDAGIDVTVGVLEEECRRLNRRFITFHSLHRPFIMLKWAQSADGYIDVERDGGTPVKLSSPLSSMLVHKRRSEVKAIMVGTRTALLDNPSLTVRCWAGQSPLRVVVDRRGVIPADSHLKDGSVPTLVYTEAVTDGGCSAAVTGAGSAVAGAGAAGAEAAAVTVDGVEYIPVDFGGDVLGQIVSDLHRRGVQSLMVEGGARLLQSFIDAGLWDEAYVERCSAVLGSGVHAPQMPQGALMHTDCDYGFTIDYYKRK